jgi:hypothetical protein
MATVTGQGVDYIRLCTVILAMEASIKTGGKMMLTRTATPTTLRAIASEWTGKAYPRSQKGLATACADLKELKASMQR